MKNQIYLQKRSKIVVPDKGKNANKIYVATFQKNIESLGYIFSPRLAKHLISLTVDQLDSIYSEIIPLLKKMRGAHKKFAPMYPNFPKQVMEMSQFELYTNAMVHYWSFMLKDAGLIQDTWLPTYEVDERPPLTEVHKLDQIDLGNEGDFNQIFVNLVSSKTSLSQEDKDIVTWFIESVGNPIVHIFPSGIPLKENVGLVAANLLKFTTNENYISKYVKTATDVLRIAVVLSGGDVSLAENTKFISFNRRTRRFLLGLLENIKNAKEDMVKYHNVWIRLGERLHAGEFKNRYPSAAKAFKAHQDSQKIITFGTKVEGFLKENEVKKAAALLCDRPGEFARRLDHLFRSAKTTQQRNVIKNDFLDCADKVSTPVLLQVINHFEHRGTLDFRPIFPKGTLAKIQVLKNDLPEIKSNFCQEFSASVREVLIKRFSKLDKLGKVYLDDKLKNYNVPFSQRSASKALKTITRGSKIDLDGDYDTIRFFIWWKNKSAGYDGRVDIDLTAVILNEDFSYKSDISYYNLKDLAGHHSGDITNAPNGASEFIDISMQKVLATGARYIAMSINSYTSTPFVELPECFAGWMGRERPNSGEIYEPKTVKNKIDLTSDTTVSIPLIIDCLERKITWCDIALKSRPGWANNVSSNKGSIGLVCKALCKMKKTNLYDLLSMHVAGRGKLVKTPEKADMVFSEESGSQFELDKIASNYL